MFRTGYNFVEHAVLLTHDVDGGTYELYTNLPRMDATGPKTMDEPREGTVIYTAIFSVSFPSIISPGPIAVSISVIIIPNSMLSCSLRRSAVIKLPFQSWLPS